MTERSRLVIAEVFAERERQLLLEGWDTAHDDQHDDEGLALAASCYALPDVAKGLKTVPHHHEWSGNARHFDSVLMPVGECQVPKHWPWAGMDWKPKDRRRDLVRAAALIVAEIERLDRASLTSGDVEQ